MTRLLAVLSLAPLLASCLSDQRQDAAACSLEAMKLFPNASRATPFDAAGIYIVTCMEAKGYHFSYAPKECLGTEWTSRNPYCYVPDRWIGRKIYEAEMWYQRLDL